MGDEAGTPPRKTEVVIPGPFVGHRARSRVRYFGYCDKSEYEQDATDIRIRGNILGSRI